MCRLSDKMMATVEKAEKEVEDITHQDISQEERSLESGSSKPDEQKKYATRFLCDNSGLSVFTCFVSQVCYGLYGHKGG